MTKTYTLRIGKDKATGHTLDVPAIEQMMDEACNELATIVASCNTITRDYMRGNHKAGTIYYQYMGNIDRDLKRHGFFQVIPTPSKANFSSWEISYIQDLASCVADLVLKCSEFKQEARDRTNGVLPGYAVKLAAKTNAIVNFEVVCSPTDSCCPKCGALLATSSLQRHIDSTSCITTAIGTKLEQDRDFTRISNDQLERAIEKAGIEYERHPIAYGTWAPKWAVDAFKSFKQGGGYAGMTLAEYLRRMKPDDKK